MTQLCCTGCHCVWKKDIRNGIKTSIRKRKNVAIAISHRYLPYAEKPKIKLGLWGESGSNAICTEGGANGCPHLLQKLEPGGG